MAAEYWLDIGAGMDADHWAACGGQPDLCRLAMDPLITSGRVASGRLKPLPPDILRLG